MTRNERAVVALQALPRATRQHLGEVWRQTPPTGREALIGLILSLDRQRRRAESDARTDKVRRVLIGARLPRDVAERYRRAADRCGQSLYAWVADALAAHATQTGGAPRGSARSAPPGGCAATPGSRRASQGAAAPCTPAQRPGLRPGRRGRRCGRGSPGGARRPPAPVRKSRGANRPGT